MTKKEQLSEAALWNKKVFLKMNYSEYINSKANDYKQYLLQDLKKNTVFAKIVDLLFFPLNSNIEEWLEWTEVRSFYQYKFKGDHFITRICNRKEIDNIPSLRISNNISTYTIFSFLKCDTYEEAMKKYPMFYYFVQKDFDKIIDKFIFDRLADYKPETRTVYKKRVSENIDLTLNTYREHIQLRGISAYTFPSLAINIKGQENINLGTIDVRNLLFLPESSFIFFYMDSHNYTIDENSFIFQNITRKDDEPVIYHLEDEQKYMISNTRENIDRYNKYIEAVLELSIHYFSLFEKWLIKTLEDHIS